MDIFQPKSHSVCLNTSFKSGLIPTQDALSASVNPYIALKAKYENTYNPLFKKTKLLGRRVIRWFKIINGNLLYTNQKTSENPKKILPLHDIEFFEVCPISKDSKFCIKLETRKGSAYYIPCASESEKEYLFELLSKNQTIQILSRKNSTTPGPSSKPSILSRLQSPRFPNEKVVESHREKDSMIDDAEFLNTEENQATEMRSYGLVTIEKRLRMYQRNFMKNAMDTTQDQIGMSQSILEDFATLDDPEMEAGIENNVPVLPSARKIENIDASGMKTVRYRVLRPSHKMNIEFWPRIGPHQHRTGKFINDTCPPLSKKLEISPYKASHVAMETVEDNHASDSDDGNLQITAAVRRVQFKSPQKKEKVKVAPLKFEYHDESFSDDNIKIAHSVRRVNIKKHLTEGDEDASVSPKGNHNHPKLTPPRSSSLTNQGGVSGMAINAARGRVLSFDNDSSDEDFPKNAKTFCSTWDFRKNMQQAQGEENLDDSSSSINRIYHQSRRMKECVKMMGSFEAFKTGKGLGSDGFGSTKPVTRTNTSTTPLIQQQEYIKPIEIKDVKSLEDCIEMGNELLWRHEIDKARAIFNLCKKESILVELMDCECDLHLICVSGLENKVKEVLERLGDISHRLSNDTVSAKENLNKYFETELNKAELAFFKCAMYSFQGNRFQIVRSITDSLRHYRKLEGLMKKKETEQQLSKINLHRYRFGHGCFAMAFSRFSPGILRLVKFIGIKSDKTEGFKMIEQCRKEGGIRSHYAGIILALYRLEVLGELEGASMIVNEGLKASNGNSLFYWIGSLIAWKYTKMDDSYFMIKTALKQLKENAETAMYFKYELGLHYFIGNDWTTALDIFKSLAVQSLPKFLANQKSEVQSLAKTIRLALPINFMAVDEKIDSVAEDKVCIIPCPVQLLTKVACCYFNVNQHNLGMKWLISAVIVHKKYSNFQSKSEEEIYQLATKYISRSSMKMLNYECIYFMRHLQKLPDQKLDVIINELEKYRQELAEEILEPSKKLNMSLISKEMGDIGDYLSCTLIIMASNCLMGETLEVIRVYENSKKYLWKAGENYSYLLHHIDYWMGKALMEEGKFSQAKEMLKSSLKRKKCVMNISHKAKMLISEIDAKKEMPR